MEIGDLPGVGPSTEEKLRNAGIETIESLSVLSPGELSEIAEIPESTAKNRSLIKWKRSFLSQSFFHLSIISLLIFGFSKYLSSAKRTKINRSKIF